MKTLTKWLQRACISALLIVTGSACSSGREDDSNPAGGATDITLTDGQNTSGAATTGSGSERLDVGGTGTATDTVGDNGPECGPEGPGPKPATLEGTVFAPNLEIPISGALVYLRRDSPPPVPDGVYCAECVGIPCDQHFVLTNADGSFSLPADTGPQILVVTKGQFMHAVNVDVAPGVSQVAPSDSNLPGEWNPAEGKWIPRIAIIQNNFDEIEAILAKIGMGDVDATGAYVPGSGRYDVFTTDDIEWLLDNPDEMNRYHIIFIPCDGPGIWNIEGGWGGGENEIRQENVRTWVAAGGKWYVTDWANEYLYEPFPSYQTFHNPESPDLSAYDAIATVLDPDLLAWLQALPDPLKDIDPGWLPDLWSLPEIEVTDNWSGLEEIPPVIVQDEDGNDVNVGHYSWAEGPCLTCSDTTMIRPMTTTASYGCGRMLFSTYHTAGHAHLGLTPQELVLLYIILEIGVCHGKPPPPPPPQG